MHITRRHTARDARLLDLDPAIAGVVFHEDEALALDHAVLRVGAGGVLVEGLDVAELLGAALRGDGGALLLRGRKGRGRGRGGAVGVGGRGAGRGRGRGDGGGCPVDVAAGDEAFFVADADSDPAGAI